MASKDSGCVLSSTSTCVSHTSITSCMTQSTASGCGLSQTEFDFCMQKLFSLANSKRGACFSALFHFSSNDRLLVSLLFSPGSRDPARFQSPPELPAAPISSHVVYQARFEDCDPPLPYGTQTVPPAALGSNSTRLAKVSVPGQGVIFVALGTNR